MANLTTVTRPYAKAILQLAIRDDSFTKWSAMLEFLSNIVLDPLGSNILSNRVITIAQKVDFICEMGPAVLNQDGVNLVKILAANKRLLILPELYRLYEAMRMQLQGQVTLDLTVTQQIDVDMNVDHIAKSITLIEHIDPALIGGGVVQIGNRVIDASINGQLVAMHDLLRQ